MTYHAWLVSLALLVPAHAAAQVPRLDLAGEDAPNVVHVRAGAEHAFVAELGYARALGLGERTLVLDASLALPWAELDVHDVRFRVGAAISLGRAGPWQAFARLAPTVRGTSNAVARLIGLGVDASVVGGYFRRRWFAGLEAGFDSQLTTHAAHTDAYRERVYADVEDGWYGAFGGVIRAGVQVGATLGRTDVVLRAGRPWLANGDPALLPGYATLGVAHRW